MAKTATADSIEDFHIRVPEKANPGAAQAALEIIRGLPAGTRPRIDASGADSVSTQYVTVMVSLLRSCPADAPPIVHAPNPAFIDAFSDLGLFADLMKMEFSQ